MREFRGQFYCVLHLPSSEKWQEFEEVVSSKLAVGDGNFKGAYFPSNDTESLNGLELISWDFSGRTFAHDMHFHDACFADSVDFSSVFFSKEARFDKVSLLGSAWFRGAHFCSHSFFDRMKCQGSALFDDAVFDVGASFSGMKCLDVDFSKSIFQGAAHFDGIVVAQVARFDGMSVGNCADFRNARFEAAVSFRGAVFKRAARFEGSVFDGNALFWQVEFQDEAVFAKVVFNEAVEFKFSVFSGNAWFDEARFVSDVEFLGADFVKIVFCCAKFGANVFVIGKGADAKLADEIDFERIQIGRPDQVHFYDCMMRPHWFVGIYPSPFKLVNVRWSDDVSAELASIADGDLGSAQERLAVVYKQLAMNAEANRDYRNASKFHYQAVFLRLNEQKILRNIRSLEWWYFLASGCGERAWRAFGSLAVVWAVFGCIYMCLNFDRPPNSFNNAANVISHLNPHEALLYSFSVISLQKPEIRPSFGIASFVVNLEAVLGPLQAALLALAIRRKFMR